MNYLSTITAVLDFIKTHGLKTPATSPYIYALPHTDASWIHHNLRRIARELKTDIKLQFYPVIPDVLPVNSVFLVRDFEEIADRMWYTLENPKTKQQWFEEYWQLKETSETIADFKPQALSRISHNHDQILALLPDTHIMQYADYVSDELPFVIELCKTLFK